MYRRYWENVELMTLLQKFINKICFLKKLMLVSLKLIFIISRKSNVSTCEIVKILFENNTYIVGQSAFVCREVFMYKRSWFWSWYTTGIRIKQLYSAVIESHLIIKIIYYLDSKVFKQISKVDDIKISKFRFPNPKRIIHWHSTLRSSIKFHWLFYLHFSNYLICVKYTPIINNTIFGIPEKI